MSSLASRVIAAVTPADPDDAAAARLVDKGKAGRALELKLATRAEEIATKNSGLKRKQAEAALVAEQSGDLTEYDKITADWVEGQADAERVGHAQLAATAQRVEADQALHALGLAQNLKMLNRKIKAGQIEATEIVGALTSLAKHYPRFLEIREELIKAWPVGSPPQSGGLLWQGEISAAVLDEMSAVNPVDPLSKKPRLPGSVASAFVNESKMPRFLDRLAEANQHLLRLIEKGPAA